MGRKVRAEQIVIAAILLGAIYRAADLTYGLPHAYIPDEEVVINSVLKMAGERALRPMFIDYPAFYQYILLALYGALFLVMKTAGLVASAADFGVRYYYDPTLFLLGARALNGLLGVLTLFLVWKIGRRLFGPWSGAAAAAVLAFSPVHQELSVAATPNAAMAFAGTLAILAIVRVFERGSTRDYLLAGAAIALSVSLKYNTAPLVLSLGAAHFLGGGKRSVTRLLAPFAAIPLLFLLLNPYWVLDYASYARAFHFQASHMRLGHPGHLYGPPVLWFVRRDVSIEGVVGVLFVSGLVLSLARRRKEDLLLLAYGLPSFLAITSLKNQGLDYLIGVYPVLALLGGRAAAEGIALLAARAGKRGAVAAALLLVLPAAAFAARDLRRSHLPDTRTLAEEWVEERIPAGATIGIQGAIYNPQLLRKERFEGSAAGSEYLTGGALARAREKIGDRPLYTILSLIEMGDRVRWPADAPDEIRRRFAGDPWVKAKFRARLLDADALVARGADYFFVSSYTLRGAYAKRRYPSDSPVHYLTLRDRRHYDALIGDPRVSLVRRWEPSRRVAGPVLSLYAVGKEKVRGTGEP